MGSGTQRKRGTAGRGENRGERESEGLLILSRAGHREGESGLDGSTSMACGRYSDGEERDDREGFVKSPLEISLAKANRSFSL